MNTTFSVEELALVGLYMDARQDRKSVIAALEDVLPYTDADVRPDVDAILDKLQDMSDEDFAALSLEDSLLNE